MPNFKNRSMINLLTALVKNGDPKQQTNREALCLILETVTRTEARQEEFINRLDNVLSQLSGRLAGTKGDI